MRRVEKEAQMSFVDVCPEHNYTGSNNQIMKEEENEKKKIFISKGTSLSQEALVMSWP